MNNADSGTQTSPEGRPLLDTRSPRQEVTATTGSVVRPKVRTKALSLKSVDQLLREIYSGKFKRSTLKKEELTAMRHASKSGEPKKEEILNLALSDRTLDRTRQLILLGGKLGETIIAEQIREFVREVLQRHPAFGMKSLTDVLKNFPESATENRAIELLMSQDYASLSWPAGIEPMKKKELEQCKENAVYCLLLWFWAKGETSVEHIQRHLEKYLWKPDAKRYKTDRDKLRVLTKNDHAAASIACALFEKQALQQSQRADAAQKDEERAIAREQRLRNELTDAKEKLTTSQTEIDRLEKELEREKQTHADDRVHLKDDYERLRGQVLRRLNDELSLLDEGLRALRRDPPKVHVMVDHAERAIDGLKRDMEQLRENS